MVKMRVTRRVRHILSIPFLSKRPSLGDTNAKYDAAGVTATTTATGAATSPTATTPTSTTLNNDTDDAVHLDGRDLSDTKSESTFDDEVISDETEPEAEAEPELESESEPRSVSRSQSQSQHTSRKPRVRIITWHLDDSQPEAGGCRWTQEQERELQIAQRHLDRCQKAWSSEQEVWLAHIETLNAEKEAHMDFLRLRSKQQEDERVYFRKACSRRRPSEQLLDKDASGNEGDASDDATNGPRIRRTRTQTRLRRLRRFSTSSFVSSG